MPQYYNSFPYIIKRRVGHDCNQKKNDGGKTLAFIKEIALTVFAFDLEIPGPGFLEVFRVVIIAIVIL